jgi:hypothetical protein
VSAATGDRRRWVVGAAGLLAGALIVGACGGPNVSLSLKPDTVSACYRGLPTARAAVNEPAAKLRGVRREPYDTLVKTLPGVAEPPGDDDTEVCAFAFSGTFTAGQVLGAPASAEGTYAVVVISSKSLDLMVSYVGDRLPRHLSRRVAGGLAR